MNDPPGILARPIISIYVLSQGGMGGGLPEAKDPVRGHAKSMSFSVGGRGFVGRVTTIL